jgi:hypothetical protein
MSMSKFAALLNAFTVSWCFIEANSLSALWCAAIIATGRKLVWYHPIAYIVISWMGLGKHHSQSPCINFSLSFLCLYRDIMDGSWETPFTVSMYQFQSVISVPISWYHGWVLGNTIHSLRVSISVCHFCACCQSVLHLLITHSDTKPNSSSLLVSTVREWSRGLTSWWWNNYAVKS